jgi:hypothetical protein
VSAASPCCTGFANQAWTASHTRFDLM